MSYVPAGCRVPPGTVAAARRRLIHELTAPPRGAAEARDRRPLPAPPGGGPPAEKLRFCVEVMSARQLSDELLELAPDSLYLPLTELPDAADMLERFAERGVELAAVLPRVIHDGELARVGELLSRARAAGVTQALVGSLGHVALARMAGMDARGDYGLKHLQFLRRRGRRGRGPAEPDGELRALDGADCGAGEAHRHGDDRLRPPARHADRALRNRGQRRQVRLRKTARGPFGHAGARHAGAARVCVPQRGLRGRRRSSWPTGRRSCCAPA